MSEWVRELQHSRFFFFWLHVPPYSTRVPKLILSSLLLSFWAFYFRFLLVFSHLGNRLVGGLVKKNFPSAFRGPIQSKTWRPIQDVNLLHILFLEFAQHPLWPWQLTLLSTWSLILVLINSTNIFIIWIFIISIYK